MSERNTYWGLLDFSFTEYFTIKAIKIIYIVAIVLAALGALSILGVGFTTRSFGGIVSGIFMAPIMFAVWVISARISLEVIVVVFNISNNMKRLVELKSAECGESAAPDAPCCAPEPEGPPPAEGSATESGTGPAEEPKPQDDEQISL